MNAKDDRSCTSLHFAAEAGYKEIAEFLLANGTEIDAREMNSKHYAAVNGKVELAEFLLTNGADINVQNKDQFVSLHLAAWNKHKSIIKLFVQKGAKIGLKEYRGAIPLMMTVWRMDDIDLVQLLIDHDANNIYVSPAGRYLFLDIGRNGNYDIYWVDAKIINELRPEELN